MNRHHVLPMRTAAPSRSTVTIPGACGEAALELTADPTVATLRLRTQPRDTWQPLASLTSTSRRRLSEILSQATGSGFIALPSPPDGQLLLYAECKDAEVTLTICLTDEPARTFGPVPRTGLETFLDTSSSESAAL